MLANEGLEIVLIGSPDHWHAVHVCSAARAGKDIYGEKPFSHSLREGRAMCDAVHRYGRVWQTGSWQRSVDNFRIACELVRNGLAGEIHTVLIMNYPSPWQAQLPAQPVPAVAETPSTGVSLPDSLSTPRSWPAVCSASGRSHLLTTKMQGLYSLAT